MGTRKQLATDLRGTRLPRSIRIIDHPAAIGKLSAAVKACVVIVRMTVAPAKNPGSFTETLELWVIEPKTDDKSRSEDSLDDSLDTIIDALQKLDFLTWERATRSKFENLYPAFKIDITLKSKQKELP